MEKKKHQHHFQGLHFWSNKFIPDLWWIFYTQKHCPRSNTTQKSLATQISKNTTPKSNIDTQNDVFLLKMYLRLQASFWVSSRSFFGGVDGVQNGKTSDFPMIFGHTNPQWPSYIPLQFTTGQYILKREALGKLLRWVANSKIPLVCDLGTMDVPERKLGSKWLRSMGYNLGCPPSQDSSHHQDCYVLVWNPNLNLHLWLESWEGWQPKL